MAKKRHNNKDQITILDCSDRVWPRTLAAQCIALQTKEERAAFLLTVPEDFREWVKLLVVIYYDKRKYARSTKGNGGRR